MFYSLKETKFRHLYINVIPQNIVPYKRSLVHKPSLTERSFKTREIQLITSTLTSIMIMQIPNMGKTINKHSWSFFMMPTIHEFAEKKVLISSSFKIPNFVYKGSNRVRNGADAIIEIALFCLTRKPFK